MADDVDQELARKIQQWELIKLQVEVDLKEADLLDKRLTLLTRGIFRLNNSVYMEHVTPLRQRIELFTEMYPEKPITLLINSGGGSITAGLDLYAALRDASAAGHHVTTKISGFAASMAGVIAQAGDTRIISTESWLMIHQASQWTGWASSSELTDEADKLRRMTYQCARIYTQRAGDRAELTTDQMYDWFQYHDRWLDPETALTMGYVDQISN